jgi:hypothetical protein
METILLNGSMWPLKPIDNDNGLCDIDDTLAFGNHKGALQQHNLLLKLIQNNVEQGFALPLPLDKIKRINGTVIPSMNSKPKL